ncbi:MAG: uroporphyrinogen-III C-methyltransferase [Gammaproteobacteria bacterium]|nr:uroporphyrinogen-III C-methyltransferase [Gammaproteobacteria bacterium]
MVDESETPRILEELSKSNSAPARKRADRQKRNALKRASIILLMLSPLLLAVVFLGYQQWNLSRELNQLASENAQLLGVLDNTSSRIVQLESALNEQVPSPVLDESIIEQLRRDFETEQNRLNAVVNELQSQAGVVQTDNNNRWQFAEAEYLLRIANQQLQLTGNTTVAISILAMADEILADSGDTRVFTVRQALGRELAQLRRVGATDTDGLYIRLTNLMESIDRISITSSVPESYQDRLSEPPQANQARVKSEGSLFDTSLAFLSSVFIWRKWDDAPDLMLPPQPSAQIKRNIHLMLEQAQLALMTHQSDIYVESLSRCKIWIEQYLADTSEDSSSLVQELDSLLAIRLNREMPDISQSLNLMRQLNGSGSDNSTVGTR